MSGNNEKAQTEGMSSAKTVLKCRRHGCHKEYTPSAEENCLYHSGWPVFHDISKQWSCCGVKCYDWDDFLKIPGCTRGCHSTDPPPKPPTAAPKAVPPSPVKSIEEFNQTVQLKQNVLAISESPKPLAPMVTKDGKHKCCQAGCHKEYDPKENPLTACRYHPGKPVFHDLKKSWTCCNASSYDWDEFMKLPTCTEGAHSPKLV
eukprot:GHVS01000505.1.p1 GENE.GHVS01000505.1~~GHVS01000505.1.p1  ORF type:complete len:203 (+),score=20.71 GHVS01000505.1:73-681(+)